MTYINQPTCKSVSLLCCVINRISPAAKESMETRFGKSMTYCIGVQKGPDIHWCFWPHLGSQIEGGLWKVEAEDQTSILTS